MERATSERLYFIVLLLLLQSLQINLFSPLPLNAQQQPLGKRGEALISLDLQQTEIHSALRIIAEVLQVNIVTSAAVNGKISSLKLKDVPARQAFELILRSNQLYAVTEGNVIMVFTVAEYTADANNRSR